MNRKVKFFIKNYILRVYSILFYIFRIFKLRNNKILITNFRGRGYGDSTKYIADELLKNKNIDIVWAVKNIDSPFPNEIRKVKIYSLRYVYEFVTAKILINNSRFPLFVKKRKGQFYIQTWHSPLRLKCIELDIGENIDPYYLNVIKNDSKMTDLMICGCDFSYNLYRKSFNYNGEILKCGTPRCDIFKNKKKCYDIKNKIINLYNAKDKKIILYAPTFRNENEDKIFLNINKIVETNNLENNFLFLVRYHPNTKLNLDENNNIYNVTYYPDMQELICACDVLITDYSSCCFDAMYADKKCILYLNDLDDYKLKNRKLYFDINKLPFEKAYNEDQLIDKLLFSNDEEYKNNINKFYELIGNYEDGTASKTISDIIMNKVRSAIHE